MSAGRGCPGGESLDRLLGLELTAAEEAQLEEHLAGCDGCARRLEEREPSLLFARLPPRTLPEVAWGPVMARVLAEVAAHPRRPGWAGWLAVRRWRPRVRLAPALLAAGSALLIAITVGVLQSPEVPVDAQGRCDDTSDRGPSRFVLLSNPNACVTHVLIAGEDGTDQTQLTMVVDASLADLF